MLGLGLGLGIQLDISLDFRINNDALHEQLGPEFSSDKEFHFTAQTKILFRSESLDRVCNNFRVKRVEISIFRSRGEKNYFSNQICVHFQSIHDNHGNR